MKTCYLAGPMRSKPEFNFPAFIAAAAQLRSAGWSVFNPAEMDLELDRTRTDLTVREQMEHAANPANARRYAERDLRAILALRAERGDALVVLPDWEQSVGASAEVAVARWLLLPVLTVEEALGLERAA